MSSDVTFDRTKVIDSIADNYEAFVSDLGPYAEKLADYRSGSRRTRPRVGMYPEEWWPRWSGTRESCSPEWAS